MAAGLMTLASPGRDRAKARPTARRDRVSGRPRRISPRRDPDRPVSGCPTRDSRSTRSSPAQNPRLGAARTMMPVAGLAPRSKTSLRAPRAAIADAAHLRSAVGHTESGTTFADTQIISVPAAGPEVRPRRAVRLEGSGVMRARRDAARPSKPLALPLTFSPPARGHRHDDGQKRGSPQGITDR